MARFTVVTLTTLIACYGASRMRIDEFAKLQQLQVEDESEVERTPQSEAAEKNFEKANSVCSVGLSSNGCKGSGCTLRPLPGELPSKSCRLSDDHILKSNKTFNQFIKVQADVLEGASTEFTASCGKINGGSPHCTRQVGLMTQAASFIVKAESKNKKIPLVQLRKIDASLKTVASAYGKDGPYVTKLMDNVRNDRVALNRDPEGKIKDVSQTLAHLLKGTDAQKAAARKKIDTMKVSGSKLKPADIKAAKKASEQMNRKYSNANAEKSLSKLDGSITKNYMKPGSGSSMVEFDGLGHLSSLMEDEDEEGDALVEKSSGEVDGGIIILSLLILPVIVLLYIIIIWAWLFVAKTVILCALAPLLIAICPPCLIGGLLLPVR